MYFWYHLLCSTCSLWVRNNQNSKGKTYPFSPQRALNSLMSSTRILNRVTKVSIISKEHLAKSCYIFANDAVGHGFKNDFILTKSQWWSSYLSITLTVLRSHHQMFLSLLQHPVAQGLFRLYTQPTLILVLTTILKCSRIWQRRRNLISDILIWLRSHTQVGRSLFHNWYLNVFGKQVHNVYYYYFRCILLSSRAYKRIAC